MNELLDCLYSYTLENLPMSEAYRENCRYADCHLKQLQENLTPEQRGHLDDYRNMTDIAEAMEREELFCAALKMGFIWGDYTMRSLYPQAVMHSSASTSMASR